MFTWISESGLLEVLNLAEEENELSKSVVSSPWCNELVVLWKDDLELARPFDILLRVEAVRLSRVSLV